MKVYGYEQQGPWKVVWQKTQVKCLEELELYRMEASMMALQV
jgi:hypothetical protein